MQELENALRRSSAQGVIFGDILPRLMDHLNLPLVRLSVTISADCRDLCLHTSKF